MVLVNEFEMRGDAAYTRSAMPFELARTPLDYVSTFVPLHGIPEQA